MTYFVLGAVAVGLGVVAAVGAWQRRRERARLLARLRREWAKPRPGHREEPAGYYHGLMRGNGGSLDATTWSDLNLDEVFSWLDRTESAFGRETLYHRLRSTAPGPESLGTFEAAVERFRRDEGARLAVQAECARIDERRSDVAWQLALEPLEPLPRWVLVFPVFAVAMTALVVLTVLHPILLPAFTLAVCVAFGLRAKVGWHLVALLAPSRAAGRLIEAAGRIATSEPQSEAGTRVLARNAGKLRRLGRLASWMGRDQGSGDLATLALDYANILLALDGTALVAAHRELRRKQHLLRETGELIGNLEAAIAVASVRDGTGEWCRPAFVQADAALIADNLRHPLVRACVPNSLQLSPGRGIVLTGANMTGKSTFLRTVGTNVVLAQSVHTCFAGAYRAPWLAVRSCISPSDDLMAAKSLYQREAETVISIVGNADGRPLLCLFDELFRGTNADDRIGATAAVIAWLLGGDGAAAPARCSRCFAIAATHDLELVPLLAPWCDSFHLGDAVTPRGLEFDYRLRRGPATSRNAIALLGVLGAPPGLVEQAFAKAASARPSGSSANLINTAGPARD